MIRVKRGTALALALSVVVGATFPATVATAAPTPESAVVLIATAVSKKTTHNLNLRQKASVASKSLLVIPRGTTLTILKTSGSWHQVKYKTKTGWVAGGYLTSVKNTAKSTTYRYAQSYQVLRASASSSAKSVGAVARKAKVEYLGRSGAWSRIKVSGKTGFIPTSQLGTRAPAAAHRWLKTRQAAYKSARTSSQRVTTLAAGTKVEWYRASGSWAQVKTSRGMAWVPASRLATSAPKPTQAAPKVIGQRWNIESVAVRKSASSRAASLGTISAGQKLDLLSTSGSWSQVRTSRGTGWIPSASLVSSTFTPVSGQSRWTTTNINLRAGNSSSFRSLGVVPKSEKVTVLGSSGGWSRVKSSKGTGWLSSYYLATSAPVTTAPKPQATTPQPVVYRWTTANVNLRAGAGVSHPSQGVVPIAEKVIYLENASGWAKVISSKGTGWVSASYLDDSAPLVSQVQPDTLAVIDAVEDRFSRYYSALGTLRPGSVGHSSGRAVDIMIRNYKTEAGKAAGDQIAQFLLDNRDELGVSYLIWRDRIWLPHTGWTEYSKSGRYGTQFTGNWNDTTLHHDHIHVETHGNSATRGVLDESAWK